MYQGELEVVKQEMARVNIDILGISELKWTGMVVWEGIGCFVYFSSLYSFALFCLTFVDYKISKNHIQA